MPRSCGIPFYSAVTGGLLDTVELDADYWYRNLRETVRFDRATRALLGDGFGVFVEVSPHPVLMFGVQETVDGVAGSTAADNGSADNGGGGTRWWCWWCGVGESLRRGEGGLQRFLLSLGGLWVRGVGVDWRGVFEGSGFGRVGLPSYAFQRERFWLDAGVVVGDVGSVGLGRVDHGLLGAVVGLAGGDGWLFSGRVSLGDEAWLADHGVLGSVLFPGTGFLELVSAAGREVGCGVIRELVLEAPLLLSESDVVRLQVVVGDGGDDGERSVERVLSGG